MSKRSIVASLAAGLAAASLLNACATTTLPGAVSVLHQAPMCPGGRDRQMVLLTEPAGFTDLWRRSMSSLPAPEPPPVDFGRQRVLYLADAEKPTAGYGLGLASPDLGVTAGVAVLRVESSQPEGPAAAMITRPCLFLALPAAAYTRVEARARDGSSWGWARLP